MRDRTIPAEGALYKTFTVDRHVFEIRYGYYADNERGRVEPLPIFPDFEKDPVYTRQGEPVTAYVQHPCGHYIPRDARRPEDWCGDCRHYGGGREEMGRCTCPLRRREQTSY